MDPEPWLTETTAARPVLLRVDRAPGRRADQGLILSFDAALLELRWAETELEARHGPNVDAGSDERVDASQDDPWWTLLGAPLTAAWAQRDAAGRLDAVELQFRLDEDQPKRVTVARTEAGLAVRAVASGERAHSTLH